MKYLILLFALASCKSVDITGTHKVQYVKTFNKTQVVKFHGLKKEFTAESDTIKKGDFVTIKKGQ